MKALVFDNTKGGWENTHGLWMVDMPKPVMTESDDENVIVKMRYAGFCGSDRGIWSRSSFGPLIQSTLQKEGKTQRLVGHEFLAEVVETGSKVAEKYNIKVGDIVSAESHITCGKCYQCKVGDKHVCADDIIIGISQDGCFAEYAKLPAKVLWPTDITKIDPRVAAMQEPFGNAVHVCTQKELSGKSVAVFGTGAIGSIAVIIAKGMGARQIIGVDPNIEKLEASKELGVDAVVQCNRKEDGDWTSDKGVMEKIKELTGGVGVDVAFEMAGFNSSVNTAIASTRRGGDVVLFGLKSGDFTIESFESLVRNGLHLHSVIGRQIWRTWEFTKKLLEDKNNGVQEKIIKHVLKDFNGSVVKFQDFDRDEFDQKLKDFPKVIFEF